jgi:hypothetical protein
MSSLQIVRHGEDYNGSHPNLGDRPCSTAQRGGRTRSCLRAAVASPGCALCVTPMPPDKKRIRTLVVDDSADFVRYLCAFLGTLSNVDVIAKGRSGRDAVALAHEWRPVKKAARSHS